VVYVDHCARISGGEIALARVLPALLERVDPLVILGEDGQLVRVLERLGVPVEVLPLNPRVAGMRKDTVATDSFDRRALSGAAAYAMKLARRLRQVRADLVHTNSLKAALYGGAAGRLSRVPVVWHMRDRIADDYLPRRAVSLVRFASRVLPSAVIANSQTTLATLPHVAPDVRTNAVVSDAVERIAAPHARISDGPLRFGVVGRLAPWKGQHIFIEAFARAFPNGTGEARIIGAALFGEEEYDDELHQLVERLGINDSVEFRGFCDDVPAELAQLDVLVHCSVTPEPFGLVVIEGMAAGLPVVAAAAGGPAEVITDGVDALLVAPNNVDALAQALTRIGADRALRASLAAAGRETARRYTPENSAAGVLAVYDALMSGGAGGPRSRHRRR
jgi:glycosyltransferase involved in cell wall biosynthesis